MFLQSNVVESFIALHEGSIQGDKTQPVIELYPQEKYVASMSSLQPDSSTNIVLSGMHGLDTLQVSDRTPFSHSVLLMAKV